MTLIQELRNNPERTIERAKELQQELSSILNSRAQEAESGRSTTPSARILVGWNWRKFDNDHYPLLYTGLGQEIVEGKTDSIKLQEVYELEKGLRRLKTNRKARDKFKRVGGSYDGNVLQMKKMRKDDIEGLRQEYPEFGPLFRHLSADEVESTLSHELTHAYIRKNTGENSGDRPKKIRVIDEAAAQLTGTILGSHASDPHDYDYDRSELHTAEQLLDGRINQIESEDEKIDALRKNAVSAIKSVQRHPSFDLIQAIDSDRLNMAKNFRMAAFFLERAEREAGDALNVLGLIDHDFTQSLKKVEEEVELEYRKSVTSVFPDTLPDSMDEFLEEEVGMDLEMEIDSVGTDDKAIESELGDLETPELDLNETLNTIEASTRELKKIIEEDELNRKEKKALIKSRRDLKKMLKVFRKKRDEMRAEREKDSLRFRVSQITSQEIIESEKALDQLENILDSYRNIINEGIKLSRNGIKALSKVHDEEKSSAKLMKDYGEKEEYEQLERMEKYTEDSYRILKECKDVLEDASANLEKSKEKVERAKKSING